MNIDLKSNKKVRYTFNVVGLLCCLGIFAYVYMNFIKSPNPVMEETQPLASQQKNNIKPADPVKTVALNESVAKNPFVDISEIRAGKTNTAGQSTLPSIPAAVPTGNNGLPQIPMSYPRPNIGAVTIPTIPGNLGSVEQSQMPTVQPPKNNVAPGVKGVFTGGDGNNMAIMSDGKIVSTGDTYQDGRIAYIGGDGIQFDDGHTIAYK